MLAGPELGPSESITVLAQPAGNEYSDGGWAREATISTPVAMLAEPAGDGCLDGGWAREAVIEAPVTHWLSQHILMTARPERPPSTHPLLCWLNQRGNALA